MTVLKPLFPSASPLEQLNCLEYRVRSKSKKQRRGLNLFPLDENYNECSASQETFDSQEGNLDVMYTPYPSGAIVWAKMVGYPW